jgi:hypothetical protein
MARATHVKKARKDNSAVKKGQPYWWWSFRFGGKHYTVNPPRMSQLTQSAFWGEFYSIQEEVEDWTAEGNLGTWVADLESAVEEWAQRLTTLGEEAQESLDAMPEGLQEGTTGELLTSRVEGMEELVGELESWSVDSGLAEGDDWEEGRDEARNLMEYGGE